ncbi:MAG: hypothetical protein EX270_00460 [Pseudomonadales bacterium]|nr:MAG: hypothetical protein EX270_00460 [Pseudomonadales bacterium]
MTQSAMSRQQAHEGKRATRAATLIEKYRLSRDPFSGEGMSGLFFIGGDRKNIVEALLHFSRFGSAPQFLCGLPGAGKSTVLHEFAHRAEKDIDVAVITIDVLASREQVLEHILQAYAVVDYGQGDALAKFYNWLRSQAARERQVILCIDDVQHLDAELLRQILALVQDADLSFKAVFSGETDARIRLESAVEAQGMLCNTLELAELDPQQVGDYAMYLLESAGYRGELPLTTMQLQAAAARSRGSISQLNELLRDLLVASADSISVTPQRPVFPRSNLIIAAALAAVTVYFGWRSIETPQVPGAKPIALEKVKPAKRASVEIEAVHEPAPVAGEISINGSNENLPAPDTDTHSSVAASDAAQSVAEASPAGAAPPDSDAARVEQRREASAEIAKQDSEKEQPVPASVMLARENADISSQETSPASPARSSQLEKVFKRLQAWPDEGYALQVFGTHNEARAKKLVEQYFGEADLLFYETRHNGKPWFVVINGPYSGRQSARESIVSLPESLRRLRPWPRNVASIKGDILRFDELLGVQR